MAEVKTYDFASLVSKDKLKAAVSKAIDSDCVEVVSYDVSKATEEIEGFTSIMLRVKVNFIYKGDRFSKMVIMKRMPIIPMQLQMVQTINAFEKEIQVFNLIVKEYSMLPGVDSNYLPLPKCYLTEADGTNDTIIMEDLKDSGFKIGDKLKGLDLDHCILVMEALGKYHALSVILERKLMKPLGEVYPFLEETFLKLGNSTFLNFLKTTFDGVTEGMKTVPEYQSFVPALSKRLDGLWNESCGLLATSKDSLNVLCHGDCWVNNMMFRYEKESDVDKPVEVKFVDLQIARYAPPSTDIVYFLFTSTLPDFRKKHTQTVLEAYHKSFISSFTEMGVSAPDITLQDVMKTYEERLPFGVLMSLWLRVAFYAGEVEKLPKDFNDVDPKEVEEMFKGDHSAKFAKIFSGFESFRNKVLELVDESLEIFRMK